MDKRSGPLAGARGDAPVAGAPAGGLSSAEAAARLARHGPNELPRARRTPLWRMVTDQVRDPLVLVLLVAAVLTLATGDWTDAGVIALVIVVNTAAGVTQEVKAGQAIAALSELTAPEARVLRDGGQRAIPATEVVPGDVLVLAEGDIVPADAGVTDAAALLVDESALTGESVPAGKAAGRDAVSAGTTVVRGRGRAVVTATGTASAMGRIAALMGGRQGLTPLQRRLAGVGRVLAIAAVALSAVVLVIGLARGQGAELMVVTAISLVVAAVPESLPAVVTLALALGARRMSARHALIRRLPAVETLGSVTVLGTDKTGTLTEGTMVVRRLWTPDGGDAEVSGTGYDPDGGLTRAGHPAGPGQAPDLGCLLAAGALCNDAALRPPEEDQGTWTAVGDPTEAALLAAAVKSGLDPAGLHAQLPRVAELPFDSDRKRMTTAHQLPDGRVRVICKGAPEVVLTPEVITAGDARGRPRLPRPPRHAGQPRPAVGRGGRARAPVRRDLPAVPQRPAEDQAADGPRPAGRVRALRPRLRRDPPGPRRAPRRPLAAGRRPPAPRHTVTLSSMDEQAGTAAHVRDAGRGQSRRAGRRTAGAPVPVRPAVPARLRGGEDPAAASPGPRLAAGAMVTPAIIAAGTVHKAPRTRHASTPETRASSRPGPKGRGPAGRRLPSSGT